MDSALSLGDDIFSARSSWTFEGDVPENFDKHVQRSVPFYHEGHRLICRVSDYFLGDDSIAYDLGCATGELLHKLAARHDRSTIRFIGVDRSAAMAAAAKEKNAADTRIQVDCEELTQYEFQQADLIVMHYTMQFVRPAVRQDLFRRIFDALRWGGAFLLFEKVRGPDARFQDMLTGLYSDFKLEQGYTPAEIMGKARSLAGVLEPFSTTGNYDLLQRAGFKDSMTIMKYICFEGMLAIK